MRRKSERTATKKVKASPEKKVEKAKRGRTRRRKQSSSSENESDEGSPVREVEAGAGAVEEPVKEAPTTPVKETSPEEQDQVWQVKAAEGSGDMGEIKKLKICLTRPPSTPERADRSPRSKRKHSRATSSSDTPSSEGVDEKRRSRRSKKTRESKDEPDKSHDSQGDEPETELENIPEKSDESNVITSSEPHNEAGHDEAPMSTTNEEIGNDKEEATNDRAADTDNNSAADTTVASPNKEEQQSSEPADGNARSESPVTERIEAVENSEVLEIHAEDHKIESSGSGSQLIKSKSRKDKADMTDSRDHDMAPAGKVSISEDSTAIHVSEKTVSGKNDSAKHTNENNVVESSENVEENSRKTSIDSDKGKDADESVEMYRKRNSKHSESTQEETTPNGQTPTPIVINRKRKWGARPKLASQKSITISTEVLKDIIPDVKPVEFDEVIEEKKHKRVESSEKYERPVLPKIVIDNTESVEQHRKEEDTEKENIKKEVNLSMNRRISIVKDNDSILARPPSPPRHKPSNILYITNLVRPFTLPQLKNLLQRTGRIVENGFWIDRIKSRCYVQYDNEDQAVETRHALHGVTWPVSNPKALQVDFSTAEAFEKAKTSEETDGPPVSTIPGTVEDWLREQDLKRERGELEKPWERKAAMREWDMGKNEKDREKDRLRRDDPNMDKRRHRSMERSPEPARKFKKKEEEAPAKLLDDLFRKTKTTPCIYWLPLSAETIAVKEEQRRQHMAEHERRMAELRRNRERRH